jgi:hypothetical protein
MRPVIMKTILVLTATTVLASTAFAETSKPTPSAPKKGLAVIGPIAKRVAEPIKLDVTAAESYGMKARKAAMPSDALAIVEAAKSVSNAQVTQVINERIEELEYCWLRLPASKRVASSAMIHFAIEASGTVAGIEVEGQLPAGVAKCITAATSKWTFPAADAGCEVEHPISMGTKSDTVR